MNTEKPRRDELDNLAPGDQRLFTDGQDAWAEDPNKPPPANHNPARDERSMSEEAQTLANDLIGQKPTTDGTKEGDSGLRERK